MILYDSALSADCYKVRLLLALLAIPHDTSQVGDYPAAEHMSDAHRAISPRGRLPVLVDGALVLDDTVAILVHLAARHDPTGIWFSAAPGQIAQWLGVARELAASLGAARRLSLFQTGADTAPLLGAGRPLLDWLDQHLWLANAQCQYFLCGHTPSIADIACFPDTALAQQAGLDLRLYPSIRRWHDHIRRLAGFIVMPGIFHR